MDSTLILGYAGALVVGAILGLLGGGGSILTLPILVYLLGMDPVIATAYSLFVVGIASAVGAFKKVRLGLVDFRTGLIFSIPAFAAVYLTRRFLMPSLPDVFFSIEDFALTRDIAIMVFFAIIMLLAGYSMIRKSKSKAIESDKTFSAWFILLEGLIVGLLTGIVGAGGGFLIIPALVLFAGLPMKKAVGTSLLIVAIKSLIGFMGDLPNHTVDWTFLLSFSAIAVIGILIGVKLSTRIDGAKLKGAFGWFVLVMAGFIMYKELIA